MSKVTGFKLSGTKRKKIIDSAPDVTVVKEAIKSIEGNVVHSLVSKEVKPDLVIPLPAPLNPEGVYVPIKNSKKAVKDILNSVSANKGEAIDGEDKEGAKTQSIEELAALEILQDLTGNNSTNIAPLVIKAVDDVKNSESGEDCVDGANGGHGECHEGRQGERAGAVKRAPLLMANIAPELFGIEDDGERFKVDVDLRAANMDVTSEAYVTVPIADFGAAMLRGMGWSGPSEEEDKDKYSVTPRDYRLGLGATPKPPDESTRGKSKEAKEKEKAKWQKKAEEQLAKQCLQVGSLVWLRVPAMVGKRAEVVATAGVPGLSKIRVSLELTGALVEVSRLEAVLLTAEELKEEPFCRPEERGGEKRKEGRGEKGGREKKRSRRDEQRSGERDRDRDRDRDKDRDRDRDKDRDRDRDRDRDKDRDRDRDKDDRDKNRDRDRDKDRDKNRDKKRDRDRERDRDRDRERDTRRRREGEGSDRCGSGETKGEKEKEKGEFFKSSDHDNNPSGWLRVGIRVKIVSQKVGGGECYLQKGCVEDVFYPSSSSSSKVASVRLDGVGRRTRVVEAKERYLETVLPKEGGACLVLRGEHTGCRAARVGNGSSGSSSVSVQIEEDMDIVTLNVDDVAAVP